MKLRYTLIILIACWAHYACAQCTIAITQQQGTNHLYQLNNATQLPANVTYRWSITGPGIADVQTTPTANIYLPVNGSYYIELMVQSPNCGGQAWDTIEVTDAPAATGNCHAAYSYYPTAGSNYLFTDSSTASDSIINYWWSAHTFNYFSQSNGWGPQTEVNFWSFNCAYQYYLLTHYITTLSGCQDSITDTISTYCYDCHGLINVFARDSFVPAENKVVLLDSSYTQGTMGAWYWSVNTADTVLYFTEQNPEVDEDTYGRVILYCLNAYDTVYKCAYYYCDSVSSNITGIKTLPATSASCYFSSPGVLSIQLNAPAIFSATVYDILGRSIFTTPVSNTKTIDTSTWPNGVYLVQLHNSNSTITQKVIKRGS